MVYRMLQHLYMQTYMVDLGLNSLDRYWSSNDAWAINRLHVHAQMYSLGDKYDLPGLKREAARRFTEDVKFPGDCKSETLTLLSVVRIVYTTTPDSDRCLRNLLVRQIFERYNTASKHFVAELDKAFEVRQFARDIIVLHSKRPAIDYATLAKQLRLIWHRYVRTPLAATISSFPTLRARLQATITHSGWVICFLLATLLFCNILLRLLEVMTDQFEQRPHSHRCWARPPREIEDWMWRVWGAVQSENMRADLVSCTSNNHWVCALERTKSWRRCTCTHT